ICAGTTAEIFGSPESEPGTYERTFTNVGGCDSFVQVILTVEPTPQTFDTISICAGGTVDIFGNPESEAGTYERTFPNAAGCDSFVQVVLTVIPPQQTVDTISICVGTEVDIFGTPRSEAGTYERNFTNTAGCDSIARIVLTLETALETFDTLRICPGDSLLVFGDFVREAGPYSASFTTVGGCDSTHNVEVQVEEAVVAIAIQTESACDGAAAGAGEVLTGNSGGSPSIRWSTGDTTATVTGLAVGRYAVTVTAPNGCSTSDSLLILPGETVPLTLEPAPEACLGDANGSLLIVGDHTDLAFSLDGGTTPQSTGQFTELAAGDYLLTVLDSMGCDQEMPFTIEAGTEIFLDLPEDQVLALGDSLTLRPTINQLPPLLHWLASDGDSCIACPEYTLRPLETTTVFATTLGDCPAVDSTRVSVISENLVYVPNAFSPNKDGVNDLFRIFPGPAVDRMLSVAVYDRWGNQVFLRDNPDPDSLLDAWDGTVPDGQDPGVGVYVYRLRVLLLDGTEKELSGDLTLLR
ncbi:MAG: gliding motility-associated C-terminal domain-containing protein, partial [Bacteroidota bacterium]